MKAEGVKFRPGVFVGKGRAGKGVTDWATETMAPEKLTADFDAVVLSGGAEQPRESAGSGARTRRRALRDGVPAAAE